jgi:dihydroorotate dehydrogenase (fumarate)
MTTNTKVNLATTWMGMSLDSPLVASSSPLTRDLDMMRRLEDHGASAIVLHSIYEDVVRREREEDEYYTQLGALSHPEVTSYFPANMRTTTELELYLDLIQKARASVRVPVVASLSCLSQESWVEYAESCEEAGASAIELNCYTVPVDVDEPGQHREDALIMMAAGVAEAVTIPVSVKLHPYFTNLAHLVRQLDQCGVKGITLFNRFYRPYIDIRELTVGTRPMISSANDTALEALWTGLLYGRVDASLAASGGIHTAENAVAMIMAGSSATMMCSAILKHGPSVVASVREGLASWLGEHGYDSVASARGILSQKRCGTPESFTRAHNVREKQVPSAGVP